MVKNRKLRDDTRGLIRGIECVIEIGILCVIYYFVWRHGYYNTGVFPHYHHNGKYVLAGVYGLLVVMLFANLDCFKFGQLKAIDIMLGQAIALFAVNFVTYFQLCLIANGMVTPLPMVSIFVADMFVAVVLTVIYSALYHKLYAPHEMILVFGTDNAVGLKIKMDSRKDKYNISKLISVDEGYEKICQEIVKYDAVILNDIPPQIRNDLLKFCYHKDIRVYVVPKVSDILMRGGKNVNLFDTPLIIIRKNAITFAEKLIKRLMDIVLSAIALLIFLPIMLIIAVAIKIEDGGPIFYKQKRVTLNNKKFDILKFRSMIVDAEKEGKSIPATDHDPRITKVGRVIRATRVDELPQILNILKGDMSVVGPRPERVEHVEEYTEEIPEFSYRLKVKGGLTGYAQIYGKYSTSAYDKLRLDLMYIENYSLLLDIKLIILTVKIMFSRESTEGFDKARENEQLKSELLKELNEENDG